MIDAASAARVTELLALVVLSIDDDWDHIGISHVAQIYEFATWKVHVTTDLSRALC